MWKFLMSFSNSAKMQLGVLVLLTGFVNVFVFPNNFAFDDSQFILDWEQTRDISNLPALLKGDVPIGHGGIYRPLRSVFYMLAYHLWGVNIYGYHALSFFLAISIVITVYMIVKSLTKKGIPAFLTALFFGLHPVHVEAIAFMTASFDTIGILFFFLSFYLYTASAFKFGALKILSILCAAIAFFTYEMTLTLPLMFALYNWCFYKDKTLARNFKDLLPYFLAALIYGLIRVGFLNITTRGDLLLGSYHVASIVMLKAFWKYTELLVFPYFLNIHHQIDKGITAFVWAETSSEALAAQSLKDTKAILGLFSLIGLVVGGLIAYKRNPIVTFGCFWILIGILPVSGIVPQASILSERYLFISSFGFVILLGFLITKISRFRAVVGIFIAIIMILFFMTKTIERNILWGDEVRFWERALEYAPESRYNNFNLALVYQKYGMSTQAFGALDRLEVLEPGSSRVHKQRAVFFEKQGKYEEGLKEIEKALGISPKDHKLYLIRGSLFNNLKRNPEAIVCYRKAIEIEPRDVLGYFNLGATYGLEGEREKAIEYYKQALNIEPYHADSNANFGIILMEDGRYVEAEAAFRKTISRSPKYAKGYFHLGLLYERQQNYKDAISYYLQALEADSKYIRAKNNLGIIYAKAKLEEQAEKTFKEVIEDDRTFAEGYFNLANLYLNHGDSKLAKDYYEMGLKYNPENQEVKKILSKI